MEWAGSLDEVWKMKWERTQCGHGHGRGKASEYQEDRSWERVKTGVKPETPLIFIFPNTTLLASKRAAGKEKSEACLENSKEQNARGFSVSQTLYLTLRFLDYRWAVSLNSDTRLGNVLETKDLFSFVPSAQISRVQQKSSNLESLHFTQSFTKSPWVWDPQGTDYFLCPPSLPPSLLPTIH